MQPSRLQPKPFELRIPITISACYVNKDMLKSSFPLVNAKA
jgi:hypothetical protein